MFVEVLHQLTPADWFGLVWFLLCWGGYGVLSERASRGRQSLLGASHRERLDWAWMMLERDNRIVDEGLVGNLVHSVSFYANASIYILAGLVALIGGLDRVLAATSTLPFAFHGSRDVLEFKLILLAFSFVVAYFKFTWSLRQFNILSIVIGAAPPPKASQEDKQRSAQKMAQVNAEAGDDFNAGIRAYYFGLAVLMWCVNAWLFVAMSTAILIVLARRDFASRTFKALSE